MISYKKFALSMMLFSMLGSLKAAGVIEVSSVEELNTICAANEFVVVKFYGVHCGPCQRMAPQFNAAAQGYSNVVFVNINAGNAAISKAFGIRSVPTTLFFKSGKCVGQLSGFKTTSEISSAIKMYFGV